MTSLAATATAAQMPNKEKKKKRKSNSLWADGWRRLKKNKVAVGSAWFVVFICLVGMFAEIFAPYPFDEQYIKHILEPPSSRFWLGTDNLGRDLFSRLIFGARMSMAVGIFTAIISLVLGTIYGAISGWMGGYVDSIMMRVVDILYSIPTLVLLILVKVIFDSVTLFDNPELRALTGILAALSVVGWVTLARVVRGQVL
ncbi:MAG: ABC transporter permease, partial [Bdellovibrionales bacterium]|nr:ABC transporter permease [Bdellovibrionales bacterium]